jgi:hypothetical protein
MKLKEVINKSTLRIGKMSAILEIEGVDKEFKIERLDVYFAQIIRASALKKGLKEQIDFDKCYLKRALKRVKKLKKITPDIAKKIASYLVLIDKNLVNEEEI